MKKTISFILLSTIFIFAKDPMVSAVALAATDLTNVNKPVYYVYTDTDLYDISLEGTDLCKNKQFNAMVDKFTCSKEIRYILVDIDKADVILTGEGIISDKMVVCTKKSAHCDAVVGKIITIDSGNLKKKGYIPDPSHKW